jgi:hypothetical protein
MHPLMRRMATSLMLNAACTAAPCFAHPPAARAEPAPPTRQSEAMQQLIQLHYALAGQPGMAATFVARVSALGQMPGTAPATAPAFALARNDSALP